MSNTNPPTLASLLGVTPESPAPTPLTDATFAPATAPAPSSAPTAPTKPAQKPSVRRMVSYFENVHGELQDRAAMIVKVHDDGRVNLTVWDEDGAQRAEILVENGKRAGAWDWPEFVK